MKFIRFPNGKVWRTDAQGRIEGTVWFDQEQQTDNLEDFLNAVAEAATGSVAGLESFSYSSLGGGWVSFSGTAAEYLTADISEDGEGAFQELEVGSPELIQALAQQYGLSEAEAQHAVQSLEERYGQECSLPVVGSQRSLCCPAHPQPCDYVRTVIDGLEIAYWDVREWEQDGSDVMGAVIGSLLKPNTGTATAAETGVSVG